jgi:metal-sulfur cluster biosynthetic enzyme
MKPVSERVMSALEEVVDPCSITAGAPLSVVDMGLVSDLVVGDEGRVSLSMRATSAMCTMIAGIMKDAENRLVQIEGVTRVEITLHSGAIWTEADMTEKGRRALAARREKSRAEVAVRPHEWKTRRRPAMNSAEESISSRGTR